MAILRKEDTQPLRVRKAMSRKYQKRQHQRVVLNYPVTVEYSGDLLEVLLKNLSLGGAQVFLDIPLKVGETFTIHFSVDLYFQAVVRWRRDEEKGFNIGVQFDDLDQIAALYLGEYIEDASSRATEK